MTTSNTIKINGSNYPINGMVTVEGNIVPIIEIKQMSDECWNSIVKRQKAINHNEELFARIIKEWNCTYAEAVVAVTFASDTLKETQEAILKAVSYKRLLKKLLPESIKHIRGEYINNKEVTKEDILKEAQELAEEQAEMFVYQWKQLNDYSTITEEEKESLIN